MNYLVAISNGITISTSMASLSYLYRFHWRDAKPRSFVASAVIITATCLVFGLQLIRPEILTVLQRDIEGLKSGEWWRLITPLFVQPYGWGQFLFNLSFISALLPFVERFYGRWVWGIFFISGLAGQVLNYLWLREGGGSSTAAFGLMGSVLVYICWRWNHVARQYLCCAVLGLCGGVVLCSIRDGHGPGFVTGALLAVLVYRYREPIESHGSLFE